MEIGLYTLFLGILSVYAFNLLKYNGIQIGGGNINLSDTSVLKGIAILMVVIGHIGQAIPGLRVFTPLGAIGVGIFLLCSGYGIEKSVAKNGPNKYWYKRLLNVWVPYVLVELLALPLHWECGWLTVLKDLTLIQPLHPFGWYMRFLFVWYILYYVSTFTGKYKLSLLLIASIVIWCLFNSLHAQNAFSFVVGVMMAQLKVLESLWKRKYVLIGLVISVVFFIFRDYTKNHYHDIHLLWNSVSLIYYVALIMTVVISYKLLSISNVKLPYKGLTIIGVYSYEMYLIHGYAYSVLDTPASVLMVTKFTMICIIGSFLFHKLSRSFVEHIKQQISK